VLRDLGDPPAVLASANGTWIDRAEAGAARISSKRAGREVSLSTLCGHFAETFSVTPLAGIAAVLLGKGLPQRWGEVRVNERGDVRDVAVLCTDYTGTVAGVRVNAL
jgi:hypothetical protein